MSRVRQSAFRGAVLGACFSWYSHSPNIFNVLNTSDHELLDLLLHGLAVYRPWWMVIIIPPVSGLGNDHFGLFERGDVGNLRRSISSTLRDMTRVV